MDEILSTPAELYQLRISLRGVSPPVWRRLHVGSRTTIAGLHDVIQAAMGWEDIHLHRFIIRGQFYSVPRGGALTFSAGSIDMPLEAFGFFEHERFTYEYDFHAGWLHDVRVERILKCAAIRTCPICAAGVGVCPPEDTGPPEHFMEMLDRRSVLEFVDVLENELRCDERDVDRLQDILDEWLPWVDRCFDRNSANDRLHAMTRYDD